MSPSLVATTAAAASGYSQRVVLTSESRAPSAPLSLINTRASRPTPLSPGPHTCTPRSPPSTANHRSLPLHLPLYST